MPEPVGKSSQRYMPGLDGLRAIAVLAVIAYHLEIGFAKGGLLGVGIFFTLSGYLITDILMEGWVTRRLKLGQFWLARARRLLPALFLMLIVVMAWVTLGDPGQLKDLRGAALSSAFFTSNWWLIFQDVSYFDRFGPESPLSHLWSLAVEEQFYFIWPWLLLLGLRFIPDQPGGHNARRRKRQRPRLAMVTLGIALISAIEMALLYHPGFDTTRVYEGTDTRAFGLMIGAAVAMVWPSRRLDKNIPVNARNLLDGVGVASLVVIGILIWQTDQYGSFIYRGGLLLLSIATAVLVGVLAHPASRLGRILGFEPLRWIGVRSYAIYLWQLPIIALTTPPLNSNFNLLRAVIQVAAIFGISALSWKYLEDPIRQGAIGHLWRKYRSKDWSWDPRRLPLPGQIVAGVAALIVVIAFGGLVGIAPSDRVAPLAVKTVASAAPVEAITTAPPVQTQVTTTPSGKPVRTHCTDVAYIGDSTSVGLTSPDYLPDPADRIDARLADIGATTQHFDISGARSTYETVSGLPNAYDAANAIKAEGFDGCWIFAMGTNDTANVAVGSTIGVEERIDRLMSVAGDNPAIWINVRSLVPSGPYSEENMQKWDDALLSACETYPNMRVYDWSSRVKDDWFITDGIHFTSEGYVARAKGIAKSVTEAFPPTAGLGGVWTPRTAPESCIVK